MQGKNNDIIRMLLSLYVRRWLCLCIVISPMVLCAQYYTHILDGNIKTLRVRYTETEQLQRPFLVLGQNGVDGADPNNTLEVSFDELTHDIHQYSYTIHHLNRDWTLSDLNSYEYVRGFTMADIVDYALSNNTQQVYTHYSFNFPNDDMQLLVSGNYALTIHRDGNMDKPVAIVTFAVVEPIVNISANVRSNTDIEFNGRYQQLDIDVRTENLDIRDHNEIRVVVRQNNRLDNQVTLPTPTFVEPGRLRYANQQALIFEGGNEFRHFDVYSVYYAGYHVDRVRYAQGEYQAFLETDELRGTLAKGANREGLPYLTEYDNNGQLQINAENTNDDDTDAEYMWVYFCLPLTTPIIDANIFVGGDIFLNQFTADNLMTYDGQQQCYFLSAYLKQGAYDYMYYVLRSKMKSLRANTGVPSLIEVEGSHWQTQNEYTIYVYHRPFGGRYDRLVGYYSTTSVNNEK